MRIQNKDIKRYCSEGRIHLFIHLFIYLIIIMIFFYLFKIILYFSRTKFVFEHILSAMAQISMRICTP